MFAESFRVTGWAVAQIFILGLIGYILVRKNILGPEGLDSLSRLVVEITLPLLIFCQLIKSFSFVLYPDWWLFPLLSMLITLAGLLVSALFKGFISGKEHKVQFVSLITFQNSGYLPLAFVGALLPREKIDTMLIYLFLFLLGFNLIIWSVGVYMLSFTRDKKFELGSLFSPPVIATVISLIIVFFGFNRFVPEQVIKPLQMIGDCTLSLAMLVVGGNLAQIRLRQLDKKAVFLIILAKLIILPAAGLWLVVKFNFPILMGLLILIQLAMPPATSLSLIMRHYRKEDFLISQGIFFGHIAGIITIPLFLSLYFALSVVK